MIFSVMPNLKLADWRAMQLRATAFPAIGANARSTAWWDLATKLPQEESSSNAKKSTSTVSGSLGSNKLMLRLEPERIDWVLVPQDVSADTIVGELDVVSLGMLADVLEPFAEIVETWLRLSDVPAIARLAFGAVLAHEEVDRQTGYRRLPDYVPIEVDPASSDFLYQINHPTVSTAVDKLLLNRLSKWSVAAFKAISVRMVGIEGTPQPVATPAARYFMRVELDINTAADFSGALPQEKLDSVFRELLEHGQKVLINGVVKK